jgi:hypothetical protein
MNRILKKFCKDNNLNINEFSEFLSFNHFDKKGNLIWNSRKFDKNKLSTMKAIMESYDHSDNVQPLSFKDVDELLSE